MYENKECKTIRIRNKLLLENNFRVTLIRDEIRLLMGY